MAFAPLVVSGLGGIHGRIAHHDLGHVDLFRGVFRRVSSSLTGKLALVAYWLAHKRIYGPEHETAADRRGLELCLAAGYDGRRCLEAFGLLERLAPDMGDIDIVHGPDKDSDDELAPDAPLKTKLQIWLWQRIRGYLPVRDRRAALIAHLAALEMREVA